MEAGAEGEAGGLHLLLGREEKAMEGKASNIVSFDHFLLSTRSQGQQLEECVRKGPRVQPLPLGQGQPLVVLITTTWSSPAWGWGQEGIQEFHTGDMSLIERPGSAQLLRGLSQLDKDSTGTADHVSPSPRQEEEALRDSHKPQGKSARAKLSPRYPVCSQPALS